MSSKQSFKVCFCFRRIFKLRAAEPPKDVVQLFDKYSENGSMTIDHLHKFMLEFQEDKHATRDDAEAVFNNLKHLTIFHRRGLHLEAFFRYLFGDLNLALSPTLGVHQDMNSPLAHYFLYTGHNSYLTGNQLSSDCSVQPIIRALKRGVRVIELDLWPNSKKDNVDVRHGGTLTSPVDFVKCLHAVKEHAFTVSEYPVILTFEDHLTPSLQAKVAQMVTKTFGNMLFCPESEHLQEFPSPESLRGKIIISTKPPKEYLESQSTIEKKNSCKAKNATEDVPEEDENTIAKHELVTDNKLHVERDGGEFHLDEDVPNAVPEYKRLIAIRAGKLKGGLENALSIDFDKVRRLSLSEQELENATITHGTDIIRFTQRNLLRIYPKGIRFDSSNYNPHIGWMHGAQMVAFNMQGYGKHLWVMHGMFRANGGCGYVKKPEYLLNTSRDIEVFDPYETLTTTKLLVKVYMGEGWHIDFHHTHFDQFSPPDFFTRVGIAGVPADSRMKKTRVIEDDWVPIWNEEFEFPLIVPELAVLRIEVIEYDPSGNNDFGGQTCLPVSELRSGIRAVPLYNRKGEKYRSVKLLMSFKFVIF